MRRAVGWLVLVGILVLTSCGSSDTSKRRDAVNDYLGKVDTIQRRFEPSFRLANQAYRDFNKPKAKRELARLRGAEVSILAARQALQQVDPPPDARKLHRDLLRLYDLNASLGLEVITLNQFLPGVRKVLLQLGNVNKSYRKNLSSTTTAGDQAIALEGYSDAVARVVRNFRRLAPPPALRPWQRSQVQRLQDIVTTGRNLASALRVGDRTAVQALIARFRFLLAHQPNVSKAQHDAVKAYDDRLVGLSRLQGKIAREHQRLQNLLG